MKFKILDFRIVAILSLMLVGYLYFFSLPLTVQNFDTGELVASGYRLNVAHPPGFPLFLMIYFLFTHALPFFSVFWRASFLTALFSLGTLCFLGLLSRTSVFIFTCLLPLALSALFFKYSVLPDVFMLNAFILSSICWGYQKLPDSPGRFFLLCFLFAIGLANHPSLVFAAPLLLHALFACGLNKNTIGAILISLSVLALAYASLLLFHPASLYSWGNLQTMSDVWKHLLRSDYGTFQLSGHAESASLAPHFEFYFSKLILALPLAVFFALVPLAAFFLKVQKISARSACLLFTLVFYLVVFLSLANVPVEVILERFFIFPFVLTVVLASEGVELLSEKISKFLLILVSLVGILLATESYLLDHDENNFSKNTVVEDYARNLLISAAGGKPAVIIVAGDTRCNSLRYLQRVENVHPETLVLCLGSIFDERQIAKIEKSYPDFKFDPGWKNEAANARDVFLHVVDPNLARYDFVFTSKMSPQNDHVTFLALGQKISSGKGISLDPGALKLIERHSAPSSSPSLEYDEAKALYAEYAYFYLASAQQAKSVADARADLLAALKIVPYCLPAQKNLCLLLKSEGKDATACEQQAAEFAAQELNYF